jgi:hypothetical protein
MELPPSDESYYDAAPEAELAQSLSEVTRKDRAALMAANVILFAAVQGGMLPSKLEAWGLSNGAINRTAFFWLLYMIVGYFLCAFSVYAWADWKVWKLRIAFLDHKRHAPIAEARRFHDSADAESLFADPDVQAQTVAEVQSRLDALGTKVAKWEAWRERAWPRHIAPYRARMGFDVVVPVAVTFLNLGAALCKQAAHLW